MQGLTPNLEFKKSSIRHGLAYCQQLRQAQSNDMDFEDQAVFLAMWANCSQKFKSQLAQDLFALVMTGFKREGYFVEVGAHNAKSMSNTWLLENEYEWSGLLVEPNPIHFSGLAERQAKHIKKAAWHTTGKMLNFHATQDTSLAKLECSSPGDIHDRSVYSVIEVETISLNDLLVAENAPRDIDYLSIDVEGAELDVLKGLDFDRWKFKVLTLEHGNVIDREDKFDRILERHGYNRLFVEISDFDAFYTRPEYLDLWRARYRDSINF